MANINNPNNDPLALTNQEKSIISVYEFMITAITTVLSRIQRQKDPVIRYTLLLDKFILAIELATSFSSTLNDVRLSEDLKFRMSVSFKLLKDELDSFSEYIREPHLNPEHSVGNNILNSAKQDFNGNLNKLSKNESKSLD